MKNIIVLDGDLGWFQGFRAAKTVAVDIETGRINFKSPRYWEKAEVKIVTLYAPGLPVVVIRIGSLLDSPPKTLIKLLSDPKVAKLFHHAMFDARIMSHQFDVVMRNMRCTKIAAKLLKRDNTSLAPLLAEYHIATLDKSKEGPRLGDWGVEELTDAQLSYAAKDVLHLHQLEATLLGELSAFGSKSYKKACRFLDTRIHLEVAEDITGLFEY